MRLVTLRQLRARPGDLILLKWRLLLKWARQFRLRLGPGLRGRVTPNGTIIRAETKPARTHPLKVSLDGSSLAARLTYGQVEGVVPRIGGVRIDGVVDEATGSTTDIPTVDLSDGPNAAGRSWVGLTVTVNTAAADALTAEVTHRNDWTGDPLGGSPAELAAEGGVAGFCPVALLIWSGSSRAAAISAVHQITRHNLAATYIPPAAGKPGRGRFYFGAK